MYMRSPPANFAVKVKAGQKKNSVLGGGFRVGVLVLLNFGGWFGVLGWGRIGGLTRLTLSGLRVLKKLCLSLRIYIYILNRFVVQELGVNVLQIFELIFGSGAT
jgi:hypothetical protein